jgi:RNA polymerase sigma-70 factor (ECF subfamily)
MVLGGEGFAFASTSDDHMKTDPLQAIPPAERFVRLLEPMKHGLAAFCRRSIGSPCDRDDVLQTALSTAFGAFHQFQEGSNFRAWMYAHLRNAVWNHCRKAHDRPGPLDDHVVASPAHEDFGILTREFAYHEMLQHPDALYEHFDDRIATALLALSLNERMALLLRSIGEFNYREISAIMRVPMGTVMSHLSRAREKMRERLAAAFDAPEPAPEAQRPGIRQGIRQGGQP